MAVRRDRRIAVEGIVIREARLLVAADCATCLSCWPNLPWRHQRHGYRPVRSGGCRCCARGRRCGNPCRAQGRNLKWRRIRRPGPPAVLLQSHRGSYRLQAGSGDQGSGSGGRDLYAKMRCAVAASDEQISPANCVLGIFWKEFLANFDQFLVLRRRLFEFPGACRPRPGARSAHPNSSPDLRTCWNTKWHDALPGSSRR